MFDSLRRALAAAALLPLGVAAAGSAPAAPDPLDPRAPVPPATPRSAFVASRPLADQPAPGNWPEANERVARVGGWRTYAREAAAPVASPASAPASAAHRH